MVPCGAVYGEARPYIRWTTRSSSQPSAGTTTRRSWLPRSPCRACLSGDVEWSLRVEDFEGTVECSCRSCGYVREVSLTSEQTLRLSLTHA